jgi:AcrR family transcriptional regulator
MQIRKPTNAKGTKRKNDIVKAFTACVRKDGYAKTTMVDIAKEAKVCPSHLFYYFESKDELLRVCFQRQCDIIVEGLSHIEDYALDDRIEYICDFLFTESPSVNTTTTGFMYEAIGISISDTLLSQSKSDMDRCCKKLLASVFVGIDSSESVRNEKAEIVYSLLAGTKLNSFFEPDDGLARGKEMFKKAMQVFCSSDVQWPSG